MKLRDMKISELLKLYPYVEDFFSENTLDFKGYEDKSFIEYLDHFTQEEIEDNAIDIFTLPLSLETFIEQMQEFLGVSEDNVIKSLTILPGTNKSGEAENFESFTVNSSQIVSIVGPTGSGKSRLLADIEWTAQQDTPTNRTILINNEKPDPKWRYSSTNKLVAQLSQNMNFVIDLSVGEFIKLHAHSRMVENVDKIVEKIINAANNLAGEKFTLDTPVTSLSGGQSRALMIADTAILSSSPIVLIDEIENAGIDRKKALNLLVDEDKIVLMATHDPLLALMADRRIVINNGGIHAIIETSEDEKQLLYEFEKIDSVIQNARGLLRSGKILDERVLETL